MKRFALAALVCLASGGAFATPIAYTTLNNNVPAFGEILPTGAFDDGATAQYFRFYTNGGNVTVTGARMDHDYDMGFWLFSGLFADTSAFGGVFNSAMTGFKGFYDDQIAHPGPFGDP